MPQDLSLQVTPHYSSNSSEYGSIYTPSFPAIGFGESRQQAASGSRPIFPFTGGMEGSSMDVGNPAEDNASGSGSGSAGRGSLSAPLLNPRRHHHYMRGRSADDIHRETLSREEVYIFPISQIPNITNILMIKKNQLRRAQNRNSQRSFRRRRDERLRELETRNEELEGKVRKLEEVVRGLEERHGVLEVRNREVEGWNRELTSREELWRQEVEGLRARLP